MTDFWKKLDEAFAYIFQTKKKNDNTKINERRLPRKNEEP